MNARTTTAMLVALLLARIGWADPLDQWTWRNPAPSGSVTSDLLKAVARVNDQFVAVGGAVGGNGPFDPLVGPSPILTSPDGTTWTVRNAGLTNLLTGVVYGAGEFVAVGAAHQVLGGPDAILTSSDGITWTDRSPGTTNGLMAVAYGNHQFVAVGGHSLTSAEILTSTDGATWASHDPGLANVSISAIAYGGSEFVAVGWGYDWTTGTNWAVTLASPDGSTWTCRTSTIPYAEFQGVAYGQNQFVAVGWRDDSLSTFGNPLIVTSSDGINWTDRTSGLGTNIEYYTYLGGIAFGNGQFVAAAANGPGDYFAVVTSPDGICWTNRVSGWGSGLYGVAFGNDTFVVVGTGGSILQSGVVPPVRPVMGPVVLLPSGAAQVMLTGEAGQTYSIQASADLAAWLPVGTVTITNVSGLASFNDTSAPGAESRFYRAVSH